MNDTPQSYYWIISELLPHFGDVQQFLLESRKFKTVSSANSWREYIESSYRKTGDNRKVLLVKVLSPKKIQKIV